MTKLTSPAPGDDDLDETRQEKASSEPGVTRSSGWLSSSDAIDHGRFSPGTILGGRYRIVGRLGRGGMGEVFRADDLKLGQQVALKFLPPDVDRDAARLTQLHTEVRMARQVSHPNVCRVYDIDEVEGHTFLSMEYVDGEDLASLLRRIGRFPEDRGLEIARQICAGLAAAHERGVVHRDFKPANVMLDGNGRVRITDFGLAGVSGEALRAGTPAYMAPEQLAGAEVTARSDIYALGLVLYELFTGKRALDGNSLAEVIRQREQGEILPPSAVTNVSIEIDRAVMRCLAIHPAARPSSAFAVAAALPGGDPLAAARAAGETPSPEMVAAAGEASVLRPATGLALVSFVLIGLIGAIWVAERSLLVNRVTFGKSAEVLTERAKEIIVIAGSGDAPLDTASGVAVNQEYIDWVRDQGASPERWNQLAGGAAPILDFWYRTSPAVLEPFSPLFWSPRLNDPPFDVSGMVSVVIDDRGRLVEFMRVPPQLETAPPAGEKSDWSGLFTAAGLDLGRFSPVGPHWTPRMFADQRFAWEGPLPAQSDVKLRVEAASYGGRPVSFKVVGPWTRPARPNQQEASAGQRAASLIGTVVVLMLLVGAVLLVRTNLKSGRADRRGAGRIALFLLAIWIAAWVTGARHSIDLDQETNRLFASLAFALLNVGFAWLFYLALEPFVRRLSPDMLIGWTRLLVGHLRDPRVGRDVLIGVATGVFFAVATSIHSMVPGLSDTFGQPRISSMSYFLGARFAIAEMLGVLPNALEGAMLGAFMYVVVLAVVRRQWIAASLVLLFVCGNILFEAGDISWLSVILAGVLGTVAVGVFLRFGLLPLGTALYVNQILHTVPLTIDLTRPHAGVSTLALLLVAALGIGAFHTSRAGEGMLRRFVPQP